MPAPKSTTAARAKENRFASLTPACLSKREKSSLIKLALDVLSRRFRPGRSFGSPEDIQGYLRLKLTDRRNEVFGVVYMDTRHRLIEMEELFQGTVDGAAVYPRVVLQKVLDKNAAAVILYHNHPSGVAEPSEADRGITLKLSRALALVDVRLLDHIVVCDDSFVSLAERGWV
ncbi:MAG: DNA repair protein RadC [Rhodospirillaceae bacterium]|nr:DNA repair protein RadC [Rhodospirillaceae bacterium]MDE0362932.1 DNA repair protein RadC [Rhodospirillaceae bacterium]